MNNNKEKVILCPICDNMSCIVEQMSDKIQAYLCTMCGYTTNDLYTIDSIEIKSILEKSPQIIKDSVKNINGLVWVLSVIQTTIGIIFPEPMQSDKYCWVFAPVVDIPHDDKTLYPIPSKPGEYYTNRLALEQSLKYPFDNFKSALDKMNSLLIGRNK